jgi:curved DNA-binding protein CbpA
MRDEKDHYKLLQVDPGADLEVIKAAYKALARKLHPDDDFTGIEEYHLKELTRAYKILSDPDQRKAYDLRRIFRLKVPVGPGPDHGSEAAEADLTNHLAERIHAHMDPPEFDERRLDFGRYAGQTLREIAQQDPDYLRWLARHSSGIRFRSAILKILGETIYSVRPSR